eukprot:210067-Pleurochrysis_carterae.AAC.1
MHAPRELRSAKRLASRFRPLQLTWLEAAVFFFFAMATYPAKVLGRPPTHNCRDFDSHVLLPTSHCTPTLAEMITTRSLTGINRLPHSH